MSSRKGAAKKQGQKHHNTRSFKVSPHDKAHRRAVELVPVDGTCPRCREILEWKKKYDKYKPLTVPKKCVVCQQKCVTEAYRIMCRPCAEAKSVCTKCGKALPLDAEVPSGEAAADDAAAGASAGASAQAGVAAMASGDDDDDDDDVDSEPDG